MKPRFGCYWISGLQQGDSDVFARIGGIQQHVVQPAKKSNGCLDVVGVPIQCAWNSLPCSMTQYLSRVDESEWGWLNRRHRDLDVTTGDHDLEIRMRVAATFIATLFLVCGIVQADTILFEDFEDSVVTYTTNVPDDLSDINNFDYFGRIASDTSTPPGAISFANPQGNGYYGVQDSDAANSGDVDTLELLWSNIDTSNYTNLQLSWFIAEDDSADGFEDWDGPSSFIIEVDSGSGFQQIFGVESEFGTDGNEVNEKPRVDTNFDGIGDFTEITDVFTQFTTGIGGAFNGGPALADAPTYSIRVTFAFLDAGDEDFAFDNLLLTGTAVPEPLMLGVLFFGVGAFTARRRRR